MDISAEILNAKILIVDDSLANVHLMEYMLKGAGYVSITSTTDPRRVFDLYDQHRYDAILLDMNMPYMDGFQVMEALKTIERDVYLPILVLTADPDYKTRALLAGAKDFVSKPIDETEVLTRIHNLLEIRLLYKNLRLYSETLEQRVREQVTHLRISEEKIGYLSNFDNLTGLPNRIFLRDRVKCAQEKTLSDKSVMGFLVIQLTRFSLIRNSLGIKAEEYVLLEIVHRLKAWAQPDDTIARFGDESFSVVTSRLGTKEISAVAAQIITLLDEPFNFENQELHIDAFIGISVFPDDGDDFDFLVQAAEASMYRAVECKTDRYQYYTPALNKNANEQLKLENSLRRALERDELLLHYQPQLDIKSGKVIGLEALIRWRHPELGLIPPGRFIGLAEDTGLILPIGEWVLRKACQQNKDWQNAGLPKIPVAVNLSAKQFAANIPDTVKNILVETGLEPKYLELELTESLSMENPENTIGILRNLKNMGVCLSIDDFGTGYSNLNYLKRFPVNKLKLDQSFVRDVISDPDDLSISRAVIAMAHSLRLRVIAEGVETEGQLLLLAQNGCDEMQGYLFSRPVEASACEKLLREGKSLAFNGLVRPPYERTILFVDDEENMGSAIKRLVRNKGYKILVTTTPAEAFELLATNDIGVILCDQRMPQMSGTEFLSRVKQMYPAIVRIVLSGYTDLQSVTDAVNHGAIFKFLVKPWDEEELLKAISDAFRKFETKAVN